MMAGTMGVSHGVLNQKASTPTFSRNTSLLKSLNIIVPNTRRKDFPEHRHARQLAGLMATRRRHHCPAPPQASTTPNEWSILDAPGLTPPPNQRPGTDLLSRLGRALLKILSTVIPALGSVDLLRRLAITLCMLALIRIGHYLPIPGIDPFVAAGAVGSGADSLARFITGAHEIPGNIYLLSITPYITASFCLAGLQLEPSIRLHLARLRDEGRQGREQITNYLSGLFVVNAVVQSVVESKKLAAASAGLLAGATAAAVQQTSRFHIGVNLMAGAVLCKWAVQTIDQWGLGDGTSVVIGAGIALTYSQYIATVWTALVSTPPPILPLVAALALCFSTVAAVVWVQGIELRLPLTFYSARRAEVRAAHPILASLSSGIDASAALDLQSLFPMRLSPSGTRQLLFANFWVGLLDAPLAAIGLAGMFADPWKFAVFVFLLEAISFSNSTPKQMADFLAQSDAGIQGISPGVDTQKFLAKRMSQMKFLNAGFIAGVSLIARAVDAACVELLGVPFGCLNLLLLVSTVLGGSRQVDALAQGCRVEKRIEKEYSVLERVTGR